MEKYTIEESNVRGTDDPRMLPLPVPISGQGKRRAAEISIRRLEEDTNTVSPKRAKTAHAAKQPTIPDGPVVSPTLTPALPVPIKPTTTTVATGDELGFFDRTKKFIGNKGTMNEFLKLCNLYSQDLIDRALLYNRAQNFIGGNPDLLEWFRVFLGVDEEGSTIKTKAKTVSSRVSLSNCRGLGPSYRLLPKRVSLIAASRRKSGTNVQDQERERVCSGRDQLCQSVLNDEWASHPTWASEDSGFVAHRKNQYEEGLHRIEEERHDYDFNIEACVRTIQQLEPIATQILQCSTDERLNFVLPPGLGGQSETIYKRVIRKIYGRDKGNQVIAELFAQPYNVIPVLLSRLKQKLEEWKAAQREWEKVWREQTQKIFWKSLDHQSLGAKQADKRQFQLKTLQNEIQVKYEEQRRQLEFNEVKTTPYQFAYSFKDEDVLFDTARLIICFIDHTSTHAQDAANLTKFIKEFVPLFFGIDSTRFEQGIHTSNNGSPRNESAEEDGTSADDAYSQKPHKSKKQNLLRGVLDRGRGKSARKDNEQSIASESRDSTPDAASATEEEFAVVATGSSASKNAAGVHRWATYATRDKDGASGDLKPDEPYIRDNFNMYCNLAIYCFFRMFVILYERLIALKQNEPRVRETVARAKQYKPATELKMIDKFPEDFFGDTSDTANYYEQMLTIFEDQFKSDVDLSHVEETLRRFYLQCGWQLYSIDRLLSALVRFAGGIFSNEVKDKTADVYQAFKKDRVFQETTHRNEISYRKIAEKHIKDSDVYKINYVSTNCS
jgi:paired amphipathic helix protein Sin3a